MTNPIPYPYPYSSEGFWTPPKADPDNPGWGPGAAIGLWATSVAAIFLLQIPAGIVWLAEVYLRTGKMPPKSNVLDPHLVLYTVISTAFAHLFTIAVCWVLVRKCSRFGFFETLGWGWPTTFRWYHAVGLVISFFLLGIGLSKVIPSNETEFAKILKMGQSIRIAVALLAVGTAPLVEEVIYRGVLYSGLRKYLDQWTAIGTVSFLFLAVHIPQYWGGWDGLTLLALLSLTLTIVRAYTKSLLPCIFIHTLFNGIGALAILASGGKS